MEDDIDIEEHDVMDNPRIKSMFPDLSIVKIEQMDDVKAEDEGNDEHYQSEEEEIIDHRPQEMLYTYEYSFETTSENIGQETEECDDDYYHNNKIILGSKPPIDPEVLYQEALNSTTLVCLENWGERLNSSPCYCRECQILFPTINALDAHKMSRHSYLVALDIQKNTARKSTVTSKYCNHCFKTFPNDTSLIKHLYELLPMNNFTETPDKTKITQFKCQKCKMVFNDYAASKWHKKNAHPNLMHVNNLIVKVQKSKKLNEKVEERKEIQKCKTVSSRQGKMFASGCLVPKNTLFQCNICHINFLSCFVAFKHSRVCKKETKFKKCGICERKIKEKDEPLHKLQHEYSDKIKIYIAHKNLYEKVLYKCPKCIACFDELLFWAHYKDCNYAGSSYCPDCGLNIATARYQGHRLKHKSKKYTKKDFIIVEFHDKNRQEENKRLDGIKTKRIKRKRDPKIVTLYFCEFCGCCQYMLSQRGHTNGSCKSNISKHYCDRCGLCVSYKSRINHEYLHERRPFTRKNLKVLSLLTGKEIEPPSPNMYQCKKCGKHFLFQRLSKSHDCKTEKCVTCKICAKKYNVQAYKIHRHYHLEPDNNMIPELLKKYKSIKQMWNILYKCVSCKLIIVNYDSVIKHSQNHFNNIIDLDKTCKICELDVFDSDYKDHENLHMNNQSITRSSFKVLDFNFKDLINDNWMTLFQALPKQHTDQILSKSIFKYTRCIRMQIHSGPTDSAKYFCMTCKRYIEAELVQTHVHSGCQPNNKYVCTICLVIFKTHQTFFKHEGGHENIIKKGIVTFNDPADKTFNDNLVASKTVKPKGKDTKYIIYKCAKCEICMFLKKSMERHNCGNKKFCATCNEYFSTKTYRDHFLLHNRKPNVNKNTLNVILFNEAKDNAKNKKEKEAKDKSFSNEKDKSLSNEKDKSLSNEKDKSLSNEKDKSLSNEKDKSISNEKDKMDKSFDKKGEKDNKSLSFNEDGNVEESFWVLPLKRQTLKQTVTAKIFSCDCNLHFTSLNLIQDHLDVCEENLEISKEKCSKCSLLFPTDILVSHLIKHHSTNTEFVVENIKKIQLYKCMKCSLIFTETGFFESHLSNCNPDNAKKCSYCHLSFNKICYDTHKCAARETTSTSTYINKITKLRNHPIFTKVYQCTDCDINYLNYNSYKYHANDVKHESKCQITVCDVCGLRFTSYSSHKHSEIHSRPGNYEIKIIDPSNGNQSVLEGLNTVAATRKRRSTKKIETPIKKLKKDQDIPLKVHNTRRADRSKNVDDSKSDNDMTKDLNDDSIKSECDDLTEDETNHLSKKLKARILVDKYDESLYRCTHCDQHYMKPESLYYHLSTFDHKVGSELFKCDVCDLDFSKYTLPRHIYVHHQRMKLKREDFCIVTDVIVPDTTKPLSKNKPENLADASQKCSMKKNKITYYKCSDCNVCFLTKQLCYDHMKKHEILDPKMYIQCKICDFQFLIDSLKDHMDSHHKVDFKIENLTIEEYKPLGDDLEPKIDSYNAVDKVQSRLISTTTDVGLI